MSHFQVDLTGQTALVTGAGADVGRAVALTLAQAGAAVIANDLNPDRADQVAQEIQLNGGRALAWQADVSNRFQVSAMIEAGRDAFGRIHLLVNAAGVCKLGPLAALDEWDWRRVLDVNLTGAFFCSQLLGRVMADEGGGVIVNIAATAGHPNPLPDGAAYVASKAGLLGLTRQCARELAPLKIRVNAVCPGNLSETETPPVTFPNNAQRRWGTPQDIADVVLFLGSDAAQFITGQAINVDGGESML
ncbi:MAG TPA: SDR family NAD(P)-dependent oxidoreductase [Phototrophicaceae bacterium]|nr:SDR family NAD(P)-dependent oxidoreductase [Phototrophicaceae bacterium]